MTNAEDESRGDTRCDPCSNQTKDVVLHGSRSEEKLDASPENQISNLAKNDGPQNLDVADETANLPAATCQNVNINTRNVNAAEAETDATVNETTEQQHLGQSIPEFTARLLAICVCLHFFNSMIRDTNLRRQLLYCIDGNLLQCGATLFYFLFDPPLLVISRNEETLCVLVELGTSAYISKNGLSIWMKLKQAIQAEP